MAYWQTPIYDRSQKDVDEAIGKIREWVSNRHTTEKPTDLKGCLNVSDINRIEGNIEFLVTELIGYGYSPSALTKKWSENGIPVETDVKRILSNVRSLVESFYRYPDAPSVPSGLLHYSDVNSVEENLYWIYELLLCMENSFKKSNTFKSGNTLYLPVRR